MGRMEGSRPDMINITRLICERNYGLEPDKFAPGDLRIFDVPSDIADGIEKGMRSRGWEVTRQEL